MVLKSWVCSAGVSPNTIPEPPSPAATWFNVKPDAAVCWSRRVPVALKTFSVIAFAKFALVASGLKAVVTDGVLSEPGSAKFTSNPS
jgi:hypothetical protein